MTTSMEGEGTKTCANANSEAIGQPAVTVDASHTDCTQSPSTLSLIQKISAIKNERIQINRAVSTVMAPEQIALIDRIIAIIAAASVEDQHYEASPTLIAKLETIIAEAYQLAGRITARIPTHMPTEEHEIRLLDLLAEGSDLIEDSGILRDVSTRADAGDKTNTPSIVLPCEISYITEEELASSIADYIKRTFTLKEKDGYDKLANLLVKNVIRSYLRTQDQELAVIAMNNVKNELYDILFPGESDEEKEVRWKWIMLEVKNLKETATHKPIISLMHCAMSLQCNEKIKLGANLQVIAKTVLDAAGVKYVE